LRGLHRLCAQRNATLPGIETPLSMSTTRELGGCGSSFEQSVLDNARQLERQGVRGQELERLALAGGCRDWGERQYRHIEQHGLSKAGWGAQPVLRAARRALQEANTEMMAEQILSGTKSVPKARPPLDLDEDLTKPR